MGCVTQHGDAVVQHVGEMRELSGPDINLIHCLTKNYASGEAGWRSHLMLTESIEHPGEVMV